MLVFMDLFITKWLVSFKVDLKSELSTRILGRCWIKATWAGRATKKCICFLIMLKA